MFSEKLKQYIIYIYAFICSYDDVIIIVLNNYVY